MTSIEIQDYIHLYSMFTFRNGNKISGVVVNKFDSETSRTEFYFIEHHNMQAYKNAFEKYDRETCNRLSQRINVDDLKSIKPVTLEDYKIIMELMNERQEILNMHR